MEKNPLPLAGEWNLSKKGTFDKEACFVVFFSFFNFIKRGEKDKKAHPVLTYTGCIYCIYNIYNRIHLKREGKREEFLWVWEKKKEEKKKGLHIERVFLFTPIRIGGEGSIPLFFFFFLKKRGKGL